MANIYRHETFTNVLCVTGRMDDDDDESPFAHGVHYREKLRPLIYGTKDSPVRGGTHDVWIHYPLPSRGSGLHFGDDLSATPRKQLGMVLMPPPMNDSAAVMRYQIDTLLQEVGHCWLVPEDMKLAGDAGSLHRIPSRNELTTLLNDGKPIAVPPLFARSGGHWSSFFQADASPMDGQTYERDGREDGHDRWKWVDCGTSCLELTPPDLPRLRVNNRYCDLDLYIMGLLSAADAYSGAGNRFRWLVPKLTSPLSYSVGMMLEFGHADALFFGFRDDHETLAVERPADRSGGRLVTLKVDRYSPLAHEENAMALRIVRRGKRYFLQARRDYGQRQGCLSVFTRRRSRPSLMEDLTDPLPQPSRNPDLSTFQTIAVYETEDEPREVGLMVRRRASQGPLIEGAFKNLELRTGANHRVFETDVVPLRVTLDRKFGTFWLDLGGGVRVRPEQAHIRRSAVDGWLRLALPLGHGPYTYGRTGGSPFDGAPRAATRLAGRGDFVAAAVAKVRRSVLQPWAGGYARNRRMWGHERTTKVADLRLSKSSQAKQAAPPKNTYKFAFIALAPRDADLTDAFVGRVDRVRRYWDEAFRLATRNQRLSDSTL